VSTHDVVEQPWLEARLIGKSYGATDALRDVSLKLHRGQVHALAGENGAGKSTLVKILSGATAPDRGEVIVDGRPVKFRHPREAINCGVRVVHQELSVIRHLTVAENLFVGQLPRRLGCVSRSSLKTSARRLLDSIGLGDVDPGALVDDLSLGQQQLVEIARAVRDEPRVLLLDEPSAILGPDDLARLFTTIRRLTSTGVAVLYISHRMPEIFDLSRHVTVLRDGQLIGTFDTSALDEESLIQHMTGRALQAPTKAQVEPSDEPAALDARGISRGRVKDVSIQLHAGQICCLTGLVGSGRTELARAIVGADRLERGEVRLRGKPCAIKSPRRARALGVGYLPEDRKDAGLLLNRSILENLGLASLKSRSLFGVLNPRRDRSSAADLARLIDLRYRSLDQPVGQLSGGNQQKVLIARWLAVKPRVLILDEPTRGVDVGGKSEIYKVIRQLADSAVAVLVISSEIEEVLMIADRVIVMRDGRVASELNGRDISEDDIMRAALRDNVMAGEGHG
jgi:ABC-type sugar transport system ATPase subunit